MTIVKATPEDAGCYVNGWWGQYAGAHMIMRATEFGYDDTEAIDLASRKLVEMAPNTAKLFGDPVGITDNEHEVLDYAADEAEQWLNDNVAPDDYSFGWHDGEFYLASVDWWDEDSGL
jgi:hypothetical protein